MSDVELSLLGRDAQTGANVSQVMSVGEAVRVGLINNETLGYYMARTQLFLIHIGVDRRRLRFRQHLSTEMAHYAADCIAGGTLIALADGTSVPIEKVRVGADVLSYQAALAPGETEGLVVRQVGAVLERGRRECVELLFSDKRTLVCTPDHRIRTADCRWLAAGDLKVGTDEVAFGVQYPHATAVAEGSDEDTGVHRSVDEVTCGVHREAKVLPLFRVQLMGRREVGVRRVYDLSVPSPQGDVSRSFVANGAVVHNCWDAELHGSYGWVEVVGHADRAAYDLRVHSEKSRVELVAQETFDAPRIVEVAVVRLQQPALGKAFGKHPAYKLLVHTHHTPQPQQHSQ